LNKVFPHPEMGFYSNLLDKGKWLSFSY
jgi:hypothetical protein